MKKLFNISAKLRSEKGVTLVYVAILLVVFLGMTALAVDIGYLMVSKNELQNAADAAALAGARQLGENYNKSVSPVSTNVLNVAQTTASQNKATGLNLAVGNVIASIGNWDPTQARNNVPFPSGAVYPDAVKATVKRNSATPSGAVSTFIAPVFKVIDPSFQDKIPVEATACAAITGPCTGTPGLPLGIGKSWFTNFGANKGCTQIAVNKTTQSCAGWTNLSTTKKYDHKDVQDMLKDPTKIPTVNVGDIVDFGGGTTEQVVTELDALFQKMKVLDADGDPNTWTTGVVVYDDQDTCENPVKKYPILGFATVKITGVVTTGNNKGPQGVVQCNLAEQKRGGCFYAGTYGVIPGLVQ
jgi:Flp pilus assembly protein TadG